MKCYNHSEIEAAYYCQKCGKPCCNECIIQKDALFYCLECYKGNTVKIEKIANPIIALLVSIFIPGGGQIYAKEYLKGLAILATFIGIIDMLYEERDLKFFALGGIALFLVWLFNLIDAYNEAKKIKEAPQVINVAEYLFWGIIYILIGLILLAYSYGLIPYNYFNKLWPIFFVIIGIRFLVNAFKR